MSRANLSVFEADLSASLLNLQRILNFYLLRNLASNELFYTKKIKKGNVNTKVFLISLPIQKIFLNKKHRYTSYLC